eukprot:scaffold122791_cov33-Attheya_sp.AAC.8
MDTVVYINERRIHPRHGWQVHAYHAHHLCGAELDAQYLLAPRVGVYRYGIRLPYSQHVLTDRWRLLGKGRPQALYHVAWHCNEST